MTPCLDAAIDLDVVQWFNTAQPIALSQLRGRIVVLHAFQMLCPGCVQSSLASALSSLCA